MKTFNQLLDANKMETLLQNLQAIFDNETIKYTKDSISIIEKDTTNPTDIKHIEITGFNGSSITFNHKWIKSDYDIYKKLNPNILRKDCDGVSLIKHNNNYYFIFIELKSPFSGVTKDAILQIASSYFRSKLHLLQFKEFKNIHFTECAIAISHSENTSTQIESNDTILINKRRITGQESATEKIAHKYKEELKRNNQLAILKWDDIYPDKLPLLDTYFFKELPLIHLITDKSDDTFDFNNIVALIQKATLIH